MIRRLLFVAFLTLFCVGAVAVAARTAHAAPQSKILRIDPRGGIANGKLTLTTVVEVLQPKALTDILIPCADKKGSDRLTCWSENIEKDGNLYTTVRPDLITAEHARLFVTVGAEDRLAAFADKAQWGAAKNQPGVGTAWLIALDAASSMGSRYDEARRVAYAFVQSMQPYDLVDLMIFDDKQVIADSKWQTKASVKVIHDLLEKFTSTAIDHGGGRALFDQIKGMTQAAFSSLGNWDTPQQVPLHQAMVILSNGSGRKDAGSASPSAEIFHQYLNQGRFPEDNKSIPRTPLPVISIWFPQKNEAWINDALYANNDSQFMQALANPEIGGFFDVVQGGQGAEKGAKIIQLVRKRFDNMWIIKWQIGCLNTSVLQSFNLVFEGANPVVTPDGSMKDVPIAVNPTEWPLAIDLEKTKREAETNPPFPGGTMKVYGDFCWGTTTTRAAAYFIPAGTKPGGQMNSKDPEVAKKAEKDLVERGMRGAAKEVGDTFAVFDVPDVEGVVDGSGDNAVTRVVIYDSVAKRVSSVDEKSILTLKAGKKPFFTLPIIAAIVGGVVVVLLLVIVVMMGGSGKKKGRGAPPPAAPPYGGAPPPPYGAPPPYGGGQSPGGYNMQQAHAGPSPFEATAAAPPQAMFSPPAAVPIAVNVAPISHAPMSPPVSSSSGDAMGGPPAIVQVRCPACNMLTMATPAQANVCFSCGQPLPAGIAGGGGGGNAPAFPLTGQIAAAPLQPPPNPYGTARMDGPSPAFGGGGAMITGQSGQFSIRAGAEVRVGRDPAQCAVFLAEPRVSGVHSTMKFEGSQLWVRDETSNNGTYVNGARIAPGGWVPVPTGAQLRFGPIDFMVQVEH